MTIQAFDRNNLKDLRVALNDALKSVAEEFGIDINVGAATFEPSNVTIKVEAAVVNADGEVMTRDAENFQRYAWRYQLAPDDLFAEFEDPGRGRFTIIGAKPRSTKYPILGREINTGKVFKFPAKAVRLYLKTTRGETDEEPVGAAFGVGPGIGGD